MVVKFVAGFGIIILGALLMGILECILLALIEKD